MASQNVSRNFIFSTLAVELGIQVINLGAQGTSHFEIVNASNVDIQNPDVAAKLKLLLAQITNKNNGYNLKIHNKVLVRPDYPIQHSYRVKAQDIFSAEVKPNNIIVEDDDIKLFLLSHLSLNAYWGFLFLKKYTKINKFTFIAENGVKEIVNVPFMMTNPITIDAADLPHLKSSVIRFPLSGNNATLTIVIPIELEDFKFLENIPYAVFKRHTLGRCLVFVELPKFFINSVLENDDLKAALQMVNS